MSNGDFPVLRIFAWDTAEIASPVGNRHLPGGSFAFKQVVSSGCSIYSPLSPNSSSGVLLFEDTKFDLTSQTLPSHLESKPVAITVNLATSGTAISDMRLFLVDDSAFQASQDVGLNRSFMQFAPSGSIWKHNLIMESGFYNPISLVFPVEQNVFRQDGGNALVGQEDANSSEFVYLNIVVPLGTPIGSYGVCGSGLLRLALCFNYWSNDFILQFGDIN